MSETIEKPAETAKTRCWCGNEQLTWFSDDYRRCASCETLVYSGPLPTPDARVRDDSADFYGQQYWHEHQREQSGYVDIHTRLRTDLPERCAYWLNALLDYKLPPAKVLELGSAHGGFVAMLRQAGFDATGLDLSPQICDLARRTFEVPMLLGPVEDQQIEAASLDAIVLMDVLEHLPDPVGTLRHCLGLLKPDGLLMIQTPCYPAGKSIEQIRAADERFLAQLRPAEHVNLFSQQSAAKLMWKLGAKHFEFLEPIFWFYDMFFVASREPLRNVSRDARDRALGASPSRRMIQAILDGEDRFRELLAKHRQLLARTKKTA
jgi:2-polyprenyl-3-methyl-5-hydroxy-6-metoxy-1,4-benzoquinol methylase